MKHKVNSLVEIETEEMSKWRGLGQKEIDQCWKNLAGQIELEVLDKYKVEESTKRGL